MTFLMDTAIKKSQFPPLTTKLHAWDIERANKHIHLHPELLHYNVAFQDGEWWVNTPMVKYAEHSFTPQRAIDTYNHSLFMYLIEIQNNPEKNHLLRKMAAFIPHYVFHLGMEHDWAVLMIEEYMNKGEGTLEPIIDELYLHVTTHAKLIYIREYVESELLANPSQFRYDLEDDGDHEWNRLKPEWHFEFFESSLQGKTTSAFGKNVAALGIWKRHMPEDYERVKGLYNGLVQ